MSYYYLDTSAIVKRYFMEKGTDWVMRLVHPSTSRGTFIAEITLAETTAAIASKYRTSGGISLQERDSTVDLFLLHCNNEYQLIPLARAIVNRAILLTQSHRLRGYDAVQLATALSTNDILVSNGFPAMTFVTADDDLIMAAQVEGIATDNPNLHY